MLSFNLVGSRTRQVLHGLVLEGLLILPIHWSMERLMVSYVHCLLTFFIRYLGPARVKFHSRFDNSLKLLSASLRDRVIISDV
jgi:hypothetical protein